MNTTGFSRCIFTLLVCSLMFSLAACSQTAVSAPITGSTTSTTHPSQTQSPTLAPPLPTAPASATLTSCPSAGTMRAAVRTPLALGRDANVVYLETAYDPSSSKSTSTLKRFDVTTGTTTEILKGSDVTFASPQISADGQWLLFVTSTEHFDALQMLRMDGQDLQTLSCLPAHSMLKALWSANQQQVLISVSASPNGFTGLSLLNIAKGTMEQVFKATPGTLPVLGTIFVDPITWLNPTQVYVRFADDSVKEPDTIGVLDTDHGIQTIGDLKPVFQHMRGTPHDFPCFDADSSYDASTLFISLCGGIVAPNSSGQGTLGTREGPSAVVTESATGAHTKTILSNQTMGIASVRAVTSKTLLLLVENFSMDHPSDPGHNGLWRVSRDGSGLTRLTTEKRGTTTSLCLFSQNPWSNVSRDGSLFAFQTMTNAYPETSMLAFGQLSGGTPQTLASLTGTHLDLIGWTTM